MTRIKALRMKQRISQKDLAQAAGISAPYLHDIENGSRRGSLTTLDRLAEALGTTTDYLLGGNEDEPVSDAS